MAAAAATPAAAALSMKLLIDTREQRVLFAEAGKDAIDFLFSLLALPVGTAVKLLGRDSMVRSVSNLYASVEQLDGTYLQSDAAKDALLHPVVLSPATTFNSSVLQLPAPPSAQPKSFFRCSRDGLYYEPCKSYVTDTYGTRCPRCRNQMRTACRYVAGDCDQNTQSRRHAAVTPVHR